jgi:hypothetical protein
MENPELNKRRGDRVEHHIFIRARQIKPPDPYAAWDVYTVKNLSATGLLFYSKRLYNTGSELDIRIMNPYVADESVCHGAVVRCEPLEHLKSHFGVAVHFTKINEPSRLALDKTIEFFLKKRQS